MQIHWPFRVKKGSGISNTEDYIPPDIPSTWGAMEKLYDSGKSRAIGVSNFSSKKLGDLLAVACVPPAVDQVECHPGWQQTKLHNFCQSTGVHLSVSLWYLYNYSESMLLLMSPVVFNFLNTANPFLPLLFRHTRL
ncbi:Os01g0847600 [Oryza sativa Japonica Group]|uniref:Os01g0847600 protein n=1 Tax=Oryza sativa subsp. japonica TaxID=39947 RepID=Q0JHR6_ORYSJ|nr:Os01g0847600 [Oryza sativa Japonica Group]|eukprot:NP_001044798.2 Os01g0847600 [Oryza sativa Japonica Group]